MRDHLTEKVRRKLLPASALDGPPMPEELRYLREWVQELYGRSGVGAVGVNPLTYTTIMDWAVLTDRSVQPHEVQALMALDAVMRFPDPKES